MTRITAAISQRFFFGSADNRAQGLDSILFAAIVQVPERSVSVHNHSVPIAGWPTALAGLRIVHISDFHFRRWNESLRQAQALLAALDYDLLLVSGDFGNFRRHWRRAGGMIRSFFEPLAANAPIYAVLGNHDDPRLPSVADLPLTFLRNQTDLVRVNGAELNLAGIEQTKPRCGDLDAVLASARPGLPTILLAHYPSTVFRLPPGRVQLVLSGHTHGGQVRFPWLGCLWANDRIPRHMARGIHDVNGTKIHVSAGLGASLPIPIRINCPPELSILTVIPAAAGLSQPPEIAGPGKIRRAEAVSI